MHAISCNRLAPMRISPFSYLDTAIGVRPSRRASSFWLFFIIRRRMRMRFPTCRSVGRVCFLTLIGSAWNYWDCSRPADLRSAPRQHDAEHLIEVKIAPAPVSCSGLGACALLPRASCVSYSRSAISLLHLSRSGAALPSLIDASWISSRTLCVTLRSASLPNCERRGRRECAIRVGSKGANHSAGRVLRAHLSAKLKSRKGTVGHSHERVVGRSRYHLRKG